MKFISQEVRSEKEITVRYCDVRTHSPCPFSISEEGC